MADRRTTRPDAPPPTIEEQLAELEATADRVVAKLRKLADHVGFELPEDL